MARRIGRSDVRYGRNPAPPRHMRYGRKCICQQTSLPTYEDRRVMDETGLLVDPRYGGYDRDDQKDFPNR